MEQIEKTWLGDTNVKKMSKSLVFNKNWLVPYVSLLAWRVSTRRKWQAKIYSQNVTVQRSETAAKNLPPVTCLTRTTGIYDTTRHLKKTCSTWLAPLKLRRVYERTTSRFEPHLFPHPENSTTLDGQNVNPPHSQNITPLPIKITIIRRFFFFFFQLVQALPSYQLWLAIGAYNLWMFRLWINFLLIWKT